ncbi:hypothetical protein ACWCV9_37135 [Streptomyces sp. NPDC001606]
MSGFQISTLTPTEERLWHAYPTGALVDLRSGPDDGPGQATSWPCTRDNRAEVIAALLTGSGPDANGGGAGIKLSGVRVVGRLTLAYTKVPYALDFEHCCFDDGLDLIEAETRSVRLRGGCRGSAGRRSGAVQCHAGPQRERGPRQSAISSAAMAGTPPRRETKDGRSDRNHGPMPTRTSTPRRETDLPLSIPSGWAASVPW